MATLKGRLVFAFLSAIVLLIALLYTQAPAVIAVITSVVLFGVILFFSSPGFERWDAERVRKNRAHAAHVAQIRKEAYVGESEELIREEARQEAREDYKRSKAPLATGIGPGPITKATMRFPKRR